MADTLPTDEEIMESLKGYPEFPTYVVKNILRRKHPTVKTDWVLRQLKRLEKAGRVRRVPGIYARNLSWTFTKEQSHG